MKHINDERVAKEENRLYAQTYYLVLALTTAVLTAMLFIDRTFAVYIPIIVGSGGSLLFLLVRYAANGILFNRASDERIEDLKIRIKAACHLYCFVVYLVSGVVMPFILPDNPIAGMMFLIWIIPALVVLVRSVKKGIARGSLGENDKKSNLRFKVATVIGSLFFGAFTVWFSYDIDGIFQNVIAALGMAAVWGVLWYFFMSRINKWSDKNADKHLKAIEEDAGGDE